MSLMPVMLLLSWMSAMPVNDQATGPVPRLVPGTWLSEHLNDPDLVLLHVGNARDYAAHIPGARLLTLADVSVSDASETGLSLQMLPAEQLRQKLESLGISSTS